MFGLDNGLHGLLVFIGIGIVLGIISLALLFVAIAFVAKKFQ